MAGHVGAKQLGHLLVLALVGYPGCRDYQLPPQDDALWIVGEPGFRITSGKPGLEPVEIDLHAPSELDYLTKQEVLDLRIQQIKRYPGLLEGNYTPMNAVFGAIEDNRPWWGVEGRFWRGPGENANEGASEESRFILNPFLLLGLDEDTALIKRGSCTPVYPRPVSLFYFPDQSRAVVTYNMTGFYREKEEYGIRQRGAFFIENMNARDFGYNWALGDPENSVSVYDKYSGGLLSEPAIMKSYIHEGGSCGKEGGCNNRSPQQKKLYVRIETLPAEITVRLYREKPMDDKGIPDFIYTIKMA